MNIWEIDAEYPTISTSIYPQSLLPIALGEFFLYFQLNPTHRNAMNQ